MEKSELRKQMRLLKKTFSNAQLSDYSQSVCKSILSDADVISAKTILAYYPLPDEVNIIPVIDELVGQGITVLLPQVVSDTEMIIRKYESKEDLIEGSFGILEPNGEIFEDYDSIDVALIPGMAFDIKGNRLGRGKGYYDRFLSRVNKKAIPLIGIAFPFQIVDFVPSTALDYKVSRLIYK